MRIFITLALCVSMQLSAKTFVEKIDKYANFGGRVSKINLKAALVRFKLNFTNKKYLNKKDKIEFWNPANSNMRCKGYIVGKSTEYILVKVPNISSCKSYINLTMGAYLKFYSEDLENNMKMGLQLVDILLKKKIAVSGKALRTKRELDSHIEKVNAVNERYDLLRKKLEAEWQEQLQTLEEDRVVTLQNFKSLQRDLDEINFKLEQYRIDEDNLTLDRWSLDPRLYYKK